MEKVGVSPEVLYSELRDEEAQLMQQVQEMLFDGEKTASERSAVESKLQAVRQRITELDLKNSN
jgi:predicted nuclease with TOPRIM domain